MLFLEKMDNTVESNDAVLTGSIKSASYNMLLQVPINILFFCDHLKLNFVNYNRSSLEP